MKDLESGSESPNFASTSVTGVLNFNHLIQ